MKTKLVYLLALLSLLDPSRLLAQNTAFTYQGRLNSGGAPASGQYEVSFALYDAATNGNVVGTPITLAPVAVSNGLFTATLDFGIGAFTGAKRWLELSVTVFNSDQPVVTLAPRQPITGTPYAIHAATALTLINPTNGPIEFKVNGQRALRFEPTPFGFANIIGGDDNHIRQGNAASVIAGGDDNLIESSGSVISGGDGNKIQTDAPYSVIGGGEDNGISQYSLGSTISGGRGNRMDLSSSLSFIGGGLGNKTRGVLSVIGGGQENQVGGELAVILGGWKNNNNGTLSVLSGGEENFVDGGYAFLGGGTGNRITADGGVIGGGNHNTSSGGSSTIGGGLENHAEAETSTIAGGSANHASGITSAIGGGGNNKASSNYATVPGGWDNHAAGQYATVGGGTENKASGYMAAIGGGYANQASATSSTVAGGEGNIALGDVSTVGGGGGNEATGQFATVSGGVANRAHGEASYIGGGNYNQSHGEHAIIGGGYGNISSNSHSIIPGGFMNIAGGSASFAAGTTAHALHNGAFVWADQTFVDFAAAPFPSETTNEFAVRATGGVRLVTAVDDTGTAASGVSLAPGSGTWSSLSDRNAKENFIPTDARAVLEKVAALPMTTWNYKTQGDGVRHIGPMAQDFHAAFGLGENDRTITTVDADGIALTAIQGLNAKLEEQIKSKDARITELERRLAALEQLLQRKE
jgi:hypothetical protein